MLYFMFLLLFIVGKYYTLSLLVIYFSIFMIIWDLSII